LDMPNSVGYQQVVKLIDKSELFSIACNNTNQNEVRTALITLLTLAIDKAQSAMSAVKN